MKALVFLEPGRMEIKRVPMPKCHPKGILLEVKACGFCGSDLRTYKYGHPRLTPPWIIGHEIAGVIKCVGRETKDFHIGERLAVAPPVYCGKCLYCKQGIYNLCLNKKEIAQDWPGGFAKYIAIPPEALLFGNINRIPKNLSYEEAAISEPASSCINIHEMVGTSFDDIVVIIGAGPIGCFHLEIAKARGAKQVILMDILDDRLDYAKRFSPDNLVKIENNLSHIDKLYNLTDGIGASLLIVACPSEKAQQDAIQMAANGGKVVFFGGLPMNKNEVLLDSNIIHYKGLHVIGASSFSPKHHQTALSLFASNKIHVKDYITHLLPLEEYSKGIGALQDGKALKVVFKP